MVETAQALQEAVVAGMAHIEIHAHLDLTVLAPQFFDGAANFLLGRIPSLTEPGEVKSITVRRSFGITGQVASRSWLLQYSSIATSSHVTPGPHRPRHSVATVY